MRRQGARTCPTHPATPPTQTARVPLPAPTLFLEQAMGSATHLLSALGKQASPPTSLASLCAGCQGAARGYAQDDELLGPLCQCLHTSLQLLGQGGGWGAPCLPLPFLSSLHAAMFFFFFCCQIGSFGPSQFCLGDGVTAAPSLGHTPQYIDPRPPTPQPGNGGHQVPARSP